MKFNERTSIRPKREKTNTACPVHAEFHCNKMCTKIVSNVGWAGWFWALKAHTQHTNTLSQTHAGHRYKCKWKPSERPHENDMHAMLHRRAFRVISENEIKFCKNFNGSQSSVPVCRLKPLLACDILFLFYRVLLTNLIVLDGNEICKGLMAFGVWLCAI